MSREGLLFTDDESTDLPLFRKANTGHVYDHDTYHYWDSGAGHWYAVLDTMGVIGFVREVSPEDAIWAAIDEVLPDADPDLLRECQKDAGITDPHELPQCFHYRDSGIPSNPALHSGIAMEDPNGCNVTLVRLIDWIEEVRPGPTEDEQDDARRTLSQRIAAMLRRRNT